MQRNHRIAHAALAVAFVFCSPGIHAQALLRFAIPATDLRTALEAYAAQTAHQLIYRADDVKDQTTKGVQGELAPEQALQQLLAGTRLTVKRDGERALVIVPAEADAPQAPTVVLEKVLVSAAAMHLADINRTGTRTDADPMTLPQSISTISRELLEQQGSYSLTDAVTNVAGIWDPGTSGSLSIRGFAAGVLKNGTTNASDDALAIYPPLIAISRIEVIKGPEAIVAGQAAGYGGVVNVITKTPQAKRSAEVSLQFGSDQRRELGLDLGGALTENRQLRGRLIVSGMTEAPNALGLTGGGRDYIAPSVGYSNRAWGTEVVLAYEHNAQTTRNFSQVYYDESSDTLGSHLKAIRLGDNVSVFSDGLERNLSLDLRQRVSDNWHIGLKLLSNKADVGLPGARVGLIAPGNYPTVIGVDVRASTVMQKDTLKIDLNGEFSTGPLSHKLLLAYDREQSDIVKQQYTSRAIYNAVSGAQLAGLTKDPTVVVQDAHPQERGLLLMDQLTWGSWAGMVAVRHIEYEPGNRLSGFDESYTGLLPSLGVVYRVQPEVALYASASRGFRPQSGMLNFATRRQVEPGQATQAEVGAKLLLSERQIALTAALFTIDETHKAGPDPANPGYYKSISGIQSKGFDLELSGLLTPRLSARLAYTRLHLDQYREPGVEQNPLLYAPHQYSAWLQYKFNAATHGTWIGAGINGRAEAPSGQALLSGRELVGPASLRLDLQAGYEQANWSVAAGIKNATDRLNYTLESGTLGSGFVTQPRQFYLTARYSF